MSKRATPTSRPELTLDANLPTPLYKQLYGRLRTAILAGQLPGGARLPSSRTLAGELGIPRGTVALAYELLLMEEYLESRVGRGTVVSRHLPTSRQRAPALDVLKPGEGRAQSSLRIADRAQPLQVIPNLSRVEGQPAATFRGGQPALDLFPYDLWSQLIARRSRKSLAHYAYYQPPAGFEPLRVAIATHIGITRGVRCTPEQIIVTAGTQGALDLALRTLLEPGDAVWVENPGYFGAQGALRAAGACLVPVPVDAEGLDVECGRQRAPLARMVSTTPSHQFPTGVAMSLGRRLALLDWAREAEAWILEDDYDSEFRFSGRPLEALQGLDQEGRVLYLGTFSKVLFPALRIGYLVAPEDLIAPLLATRRFIDVHLPILEQMALADFMQEGHFARHLRRMRQHYQERRDLLVHELRLHLGGLLEVVDPEAGMQLVGWLPPGVDDERAADMATEVGLAVVPISRYSLGPLPRGGLHFGFAGTDEEGIRRGVHLLATALADLCVRP